MELAAIIRALMALAAVLALIVLTAWAARRLGLEKRLAGVRKSGRLELRESLMLDARRRVVILRRDKREHLVLLTPEQALVLESYDAPSDD